MNTTGQTTSNNDHISRLLAEREKYLDKEDEQLLKECEQFLKEPPGRDLPEGCQFGAIWAQHDASYEQLRLLVLAFWDSDDDELTSLSLPDACREESVDAFDKEEFICGFLLGAEAIYCAVEAAADENHDDFASN